MILDLSLLLHSISPSFSLSNAQVLGIPSSHMPKGEGDCFYIKNEEKDCCSSVEFAVKDQKLIKRFKKLRSYLEKKDL